MERRNSDRIEDLQNGYSIIQNDEYFSFGTDAILLAHFADIKENERVVDFCTGCGIIPILLAAKKTDAHITGIEIQKELADMAAQSIELNELNASIDIVHGDIKNVLDYVKHGVDVVVVNPPYEKADTGKQSANNFVNIAKREIMSSLEDVISSAGKVLRTGGRFYIIYRVGRFAELMERLRQYKLEPKQIALVAQRQGQAPNFALVEARKGANEGLGFLPTLYVYEKDGGYTDELKEIYHIEEAD
ncbi:MAG: tRNA1(Val) (adenine(37)-N6)-methyltransferase [Clostridia bacterium]|jgi:tRNA1Val (adenine37-N6)-methyltransferase|nr:tRNA1(Val) (adenine(37)-N6)-methyltransferase [Clostridia bacterium]MBT7123246.1 tRNA1(Val) (adenine(37)-N6)-methyltransferase [Clostridia bacterium]